MVVFQGFKAGRLLTKERVCYATCREWVPTLRCAQRSRTADKYQGSPQDSMPGGQQLQYDASNALDNARYASCDGGACLLKLDGVNAIGGVRPQQVDGRCASPAWRCWYTASKMNHVPSKIHLQSANSLRGISLLALLLFFFFGSDSICMSLQIWCVLCRDSHEGLW